MNMNETQEIANDGEKHLSFKQLGFIMRLANRMSSDEASDLIKTLLKRDVLIDQE